MPHRLAFLLILIGLDSLSAQPLDFAINWGEQFEGLHRSTLHGIVGHDANGIYAIRVHYGTVEFNSYYLERYDNHFKLARSIELEITEGVEKARIQTVLYLNNNLYVFYLLRNHATHKGELFVRRINKTTLTPEAAKLKLGEADDGKRARELTFRIRTSRDSSKVAVSYEFVRGPSDTKSYGFIVLDDNLQLLWKPKAIIQYEKEFFVMENFKIDNNGNVYVLGVSFGDTRDSKREGKPNYTYEVHAWSDNGNTIRTYPVAMEDRFLTDMQIEVIDSKNLICAGFYSTKGTFSIRGTYFLTLDLETRQIKTTSFKEFQPDFIMENLTERDASEVRRLDRGEEPELYEYELNYLLVGKDGSAILVGEQYFVEETEEVSPYNGRVTKSRYFYYNDIIAVKIDPHGQILWAEKVAKSQRTTNDGGFSSSYSLAIVNGRICFFFNDRPENLTYKGVGRPLPYDAKESIVILASLNQRGEQTRQAVFTSSREVITRPKACEQVSNHEVILFAQWLKMQQFARVVFD